MYRRPKYYLKHEVLLPISFHDTDAMKVVWHGNYIKYFELARESLFNSFQFSYDRMKEYVFAMPITECCCKYRKPLSVTDKFAKVICMLCEYDVKFEICYEVYAKDSDTLCAYGKTQQVIINATNGELFYETPEVLVKAIERYKNEHQ